MESEMNRPAEPESPTIREAMKRGSEAFNHTKRAVSKAYDRSTHAIGDTYGQAVAYGRKNPGKTAAIAFGIGVGLGMLLLGSKRRSRMRRYGEPVVNALAHMAKEFVRSL